MQIKMNEPAAAPFKPVAFTQEHEAPQQEQPLAEPSSTPSDIRSASPEPRLSTQLYVPPHMHRAKEPGSSAQNSQK
jgi:hypothetical protein